ncbi:hypothetical protein FRB94_000988 [Tulasnella sp. JGI-2019a]|nr:hypothetical protein FRB93_003567 [Tulasnella sp. JGI-2019a]KAG9006083.1 hypothetical protein FRB94_000988 [Tulasnella sp. JGI-2019a]
MFELLETEMPPHPHPRRELAGMMSEVEHDQTLSKISPQVSSKHQKEHAIDATACLAEWPQDNANGVPSELLEQLDVATEAVDDVDVKRNAGEGYDNAEYQKNKGEDRFAGRGVEDDAKVEHGGAHPLKATGNTDSLQVEGDYAPVPYLARVENSEGLDKNKEWKLDMKTKILGSERLTLRPVLEDARNILTSAPFLFTTCQGHLRGTRQFSNLGISHRDIPLRNLLKSGKGFDLLIAPSFTPYPNLAPKVGKDNAQSQPPIMGTLLFTALDHFTKRHLSNHQFYHDIESIFWVLVWACFGSPKTKGNTPSYHLIYLLSPSDSVSWGKCSLFSELKQNQVVDLYEDVRIFLRDFGRLFRGRGERKCTFESVHTLLAETRIRLEKAGKAGMQAAGVVDLPSVSVQSTAMAVPEQESPKRPGNEGVGADSKRPRKSGGD